MTRSKFPSPHVRAWFSYALAAEVFSACGLAIFLPITLEQLGREIGYYAPEYIEPCSISNSAADGLERICKAKILGTWVDTASFSMYVKSIAVAIQAICIISIGPLADSAYWRKRLLIIFAYSGSISAILFLFFPSTPSVSLPLIAALLFIIGNTAYATSIVCSNAFLPILAREDEDVKKAFKESVPIISESSENSQDDDDTVGYRRASIDEEGENVIPNGLGIAVRAISTTDLAESDPDPLSSSGISPLGSRTHYETLLSLTISRLSSTGTALGFFSGVSVLTLLLIPVLLLNGTTFSLRLAIGLSGIWWAIFTIPSWIGLPSGSSSSLNEISEDTSTVKEKFGFKEAWKRIGHMLKPNEIRKLPNLYTFLIAWMFLSDGFHTATYSAILFASSVLSMSASKIILIGILVQLSAVISSILVPKLQHSLSSKNSNKPITNFKVLLYTVLAASLIPTYTCLGLILPFGGLRSEYEMYFLAIWFGLVFGPFLSYSRAVYTELIPPGHESTFFSLFAFTDKSASFIGPAIVGLIADFTGNLRFGFIFLLFMLVIPIPVLLQVSIRKGKEDAKIWSEDKIRSIGREDETTGLLAE
ncbi:uncharacterized protein L201_006042 [Kwoniella dendrophila CBS 6074]|uniref:Autophagy-related protein n=1 Tax=Kwoniella dendrophila CBS 6074 TaxID=1295534 RepID=A0AAX4K0M2_9TREE